MKRGLGFLKNEETKKKGEDTMVFYEMREAGTPGVRPLQSLEEKIRKMKKERRNKEEGRNTSVLRSL